MARQAALKAVEQIAEAVAQARQLGLRGVVAGMAAVGSA
jgi:hypothetical protein